MSKHDEIAERLANKFNTEYKSDKGIDIVTPKRVIEVEVHKSTLGQGIDQVEHSSKARYLAVPKTVQKETIALTKGTGIGVMSEFGKILKRASR